MKKIVALFSTFLLSVALVNEIRAQRSMECFGSGNVKCVIRFVDEDPALPYYRTQKSVERADEMCQDVAVMADKTMLILRGIAGHYSGRDWPRGALDEPPALEYARRRGYDGKVLDVAGATGPRSPQTMMALAEFRRDKSVVALYGFSGGGYNILHILHGLSPSERIRLDLLVVLGATPRNSIHNYEYLGFYKLIYRGDPPGGHMEGPRALLATLH